jgi:hypothetical protein
MRFLSLIWTGLVIVSLSGCKNESKNTEAEDDAGHNDRTVISQRQQANGLFARMREKAQARASSDSSNYLSVESKESYNPFVKVVVDDFIKQLDSLPEAQKLFDGWDEGSEGLEEVEIAFFKPIRQFGKSFQRMSAETKDDILRASKTAFYENKAKMISELPSLKPEVDEAYDEVMRELETKKPENVRSRALENLKRKAQIKGLHEPFARVWKEAEEIFIRESFRVGMTYIPGLYEECIKGINEAKRVVLANFPNAQHVQADVPVLAKAIENKIQEMLKRYRSQANHYLSK